MIRWYLILLPLCLLLQDRPDCREQILGSGDLEAVPVIQDQAPFHKVGLKGVDFLINYHPEQFLEMCLERYKQEVKGYSAKLIKRERVDGKLQPLEKIEVCFREQPFSVYMNWLEGGVGLFPPQRVLYVKGENNDKLMARGRGIAGIKVFDKDIHGQEAKSTGIYTIDQFGIYLGTVRTLAAMRKAQEHGSLHVAYRGLYTVPELGDRVCYTFVRTPYEPPEDDGVNLLTIYIDQENWLQIGSVLKDVEGQLIAEYFFRDVKINPEFKDNQFTREQVAAFSR